MAVAGPTGVLLEQAWSALGGDSRLVDGVVLTGEEAGLLPSRLAALPAMVAAVSASTLAASVLDAARRSAAPAPIRVDREHVALAARSERYARAVGAERAEQFAPLSRFWRTADGWLRLHANYAWHRERALTVLDTDGSEQAVAQAVARWRGEDLEEALAAAGALGYAVRSPGQWRAHPQGRAVAALPLLTGTDAPGPGRPAGTGRAATGARVLDLTRVIAGPVATRTLAAWGAQVLRLDSPMLPEIPAQAVDTLPGKRSAELDLARPAGRARLEELLSETDVLVQGYRPGALGRYGLDPADLAHRHTHLNVVTLSAWGPVGPWSARRGFDSLVQCPTGIAVLEGGDGRPGTLPAQLLDHATGHLAAAAALLALAVVARGEPPRQVQLSLAQTARWLLGAGTAAPDAARDLDPDRYLVTLPRGPDRVQVVAPPGRAGDLVPGWLATTHLGADAPTFRD